MTKQCSACGLNKPESDFYEYRQKATGTVRLSPDCRPCRRATVAAYRQANPEKVAESKRRAVAKNPEKYAALHDTWKASNRDRFLAYQRRYNEKRRDAKRQTERDRYRRNPERIKERSRLWEEKNPERVRLRRHERRARKSGVVKVAEWRALVELCEHRCLCCKRTDIPLTMDHIVPISGGGEHRIDNLQPLCKPCNSRKNARVIDYRTPEIISRTKDRLRQYQEESAR